VKLWNKDKFDYLHSSQYCIFVYFLSNTIWKQSGDTILPTKLFILNKALNGIDLFYDSATETELKDKKLRYEDALNSVKSAIEMGVVPGGGACMLYMSCDEKLKQKYEVDHIKPLASGGTNDIKNLQLLCKSCHKEKTQTEKEDGSYVRIIETESSFNNQVNDIMNSTLCERYAFIENVVPLESEE
jgi:hypothetical protein